MKRILIISGLSVCCILAGCSKKNSNSGCSNTVSVTEGPTTFTECGNADYMAQAISAGLTVYDAVGVSVARTDTNSRLMLIVSKTYPFSLGIQYAFGPAAGAGVYQVPSQYQQQNIYRDYVNGMQSYECTSGTITVSRCDSDNISGSFSLNISGGAISKTITGVFSANKPVLSH